LRYGRPPLPDFLRLVSVARGDRGETRLAPGPRTVVAPGMLGKRVPVRSIVAESESEPEPERSSGRESQLDSRNSEFEPELRDSSADKKLAHDGDGEKGAPG